MSLSCVKLLLPSSRCVKSDVNRPLEEEVSLTINSNSSDYPHACTVCIHTQTHTCANTMYVQVYVYTRLCANTHTVHLPSPRSSPLPLPHSTPPLHLHPSPTAPLLFILTLPHSTPPLHHPHSFSSPPLPHSTPPFHLHPSPAPLLTCREYTVL